MVCQVPIESIDGSLLARLTSASPEHLRFFRDNSRNTANKQSVIIPYYLSVNSDFTRSTNQWDVYTRNSVLKLNSPPARVRLPGSISMLSNYFLSYS